MVTERYNTLNLEGMVWRSDLAAMLNSCLSRSPIAERSKCDDLQL